MYSKIVKPDKIPAWRNHHCRTLRTTIDTIEQLQSSNWCNGNLNAPNMPKDMTKWSFSTTTLGHTLLKLSRKLRKHLTGMFYPIRRIFQTLLLRTTTCSGWWLRVWLSSTSLLMKKPIIRSILGSPQKMKDFFKRGIRMLPERWSKVVERDRQYFE